MATFITIILSSLAGVAWARKLEWTDAARAARVDVAWGLAASPLAVGMQAIILFSMPELNLLSTAWTVVLFNAVLLGAAISTPSRQPAAPPLAPSAGILIIVGGLSVMLASVISAAAAIPFYANDALEYVMVAKEILRANSLAVYPLVADNPSGFHGPWTHPPMYPAMLAVFGSVDENIAISTSAKIVAVWFGATAAILVFTLGCVTSRFTGLIAAVLFLSTPIAFDNFRTALVDALPLSGLLATVAAVTCLRDGGIRRSLIGGATLGVALWTHSLAMLFVPIYAAVVAVQTGLLQWRRAVVEIGVAIPIAVLIASFPYIRNLQVYGSLISDNPEVFAMPSLDWPGYFEVARGIDSLASAVQYGIFKGWFAISAFGPTFWLASIGIIVFAVSHWQAIRRAPLRGLTGEEIRTTAGAIVVLAVYTAGVAFTVLIGSEALIKNERYLVAIIPFAALIAGVGLAPVVEKTAAYVVNPAKNEVRREAAFILGASAAAIVLLLPLAFHAALTLHTFRSDVSYVGRQNYIRAQPNTATTSWLSENTPEDALIVSMRPADMIFSGRKMISYLDPAMRRVYDAQTAEEAVNEMRKMGATHLYIPNYFLPPINRTKIMELLAREDLTSLIYDQAGFQIYRLDGGPPKAESPAPRVDTISDWQRFQRAKTPVLGRLLQLDVKPHPHSVGEVSLGRVPLGLFNRDFETIITTSTPVNLRDRGATEDVLVELEFSGRGYIVVSVSDGRGNDIVIADIALRPGEKERISRRVRFSTAPEEMNVTISHLGNSSVTLLDARVVRR